MESRCQMMMLMLAVVVSVWLVEDAEAGCGLKRLCCSAHNNTCAARGPRTSDPTSAVCFCDEYCVKTGDCCTDYNRTCQAVDCQLSDWHAWEECSVPCGRGVMMRRRDIVVEPRNSGQACEATTERRLCWGTACKVTRALSGVEELKETAKIIPAMFGAFRSAKKYDPYTDPLRANLYQQYHKQANDAASYRPTYHTTFTIVRTTGVCASENAPAWVQQLSKGAQVCVECQEFAMKKKLGVRCKGDGVVMKETRWDAVTAPGCHGIWMKTAEATEGTCEDASHSQAFIFI